MSGLTLSPRLRNIVAPIVSVLLVVAALALIANSVGRQGIEETGRRLRHADLLFLGVAAGFNLFRYGLWAARWRWLMQPVRSVRWLSAFRALMVSVLLNTVVPAARAFGGLVRARRLGRTEGGATGPLYGAAVVDQFGYSVVSAIVGALCLPWAFLPARSGQPRWPLWVLLALAAVSVAVWLRSAERRGRLGDWMRRRLPRATATMQGGMEAARTILARRRTFILMATLGSAVWMLNAVTLWFAGHATGSPFPFGLALSAWALGSLAGAATGTPGGAGTTELAAIQPLTSHGIDPGEALAAVLLARGLHYLSAILLGGLCLVFPGAAAPAGSD